MAVRIALSWAFTGLPLELEADDVNQYRDGSEAIGHKLDPGNTGEIPIILRVDKYLRLVCKGCAIQMEELEEDWHKRMQPEKK